MLILHQKAKHFKCLCCSRRLNSASGLVVHMAQIHKESIDTVPNSIHGHDTPEIEVFGMQGVPPEDLQRHYDGLPIVPYKKSRMGDAGLVSMLAAQKAALSGNPLPMSAHIHLKQVQVLEGIGPSQAIPHIPKSMEQSMIEETPISMPSYQQHIPVMPLPVQSPPIPTSIPMPIIPPIPQPPRHDLPSIPIAQSFTPVKVNGSFDTKTGKRQPTSFIMIADSQVSPVLFFIVFPC